MTQLLDALDPAIAANVIDAGQDGPSLMLAIQQAVAGRATASRCWSIACSPAIPANRRRSSAREAPFPRAPWLIASVLHVPVVLAFGLYRGGNRYDLAFESFSDGLQIPRGRARAGAVGAYPALRRPTGTLRPPRPLQLVQLL